MPAWAPLQNGRPVTPTLTPALSPSDVTLTPTSMAGFPVAGQFTLRVQETGELLLVTATNAGSPNTWTVTRGIGGSTAQAIPIGYHVEYCMTVEMVVGALFSPLVSVTPAAVANFTLGGLDLNTDKMYELDFRGTWNGTFGNSEYLELRPNAAAPANVFHVERRDYANATGDFGRGTQAYLEMLRTDFTTNGGLDVWFRSRISILTSGRRMFETDSMFLSTVTQMMRARRHAIWHDTTPNITSLQVVASAGTLTGTATVKVVR